MQAAKHLASHNSVARAHRQSPRSNRADTKEDESLSPSSRKDKYVPKAPGGSVISNEKKKHSSIKDDDSAKKGKRPLVVFAAGDAAEEFLQLTLKGKYPENKILKWLSVLKEHEISTVRQLCLLDTLPSKWDRLGLPLGVEIELREALNICSFDEPKPEADESDAASDVGAKDSALVVETVAAIDTTGEPEFVRQIRDKLVQLESTHPIDSASGSRMEFTYVLIQVSILKLHHLDTLTMDADAEIEFLMWWMDKSLQNAGDGGPDDWKPQDESFSVRTMWKPDPRVDGLADPHPLDRHEENFWIWPSWVPHGIVSHTQKWAGKLSVPMDLKEFPFDQQTLQLIVSSPSYDTETGIRFIPYGSNDAKYSAETQRAIHLIEFAYNGPLTVTEERIYSDLETVEKSVVTLTQHIRRHTGFYLAKVVSLIFLIGCAVWVVPILPPSALNDRFTIVVTILLTQVALNFVLAESLPKVPYLTRMDTYLLLNYIFLCLGAIECVAVYLIDKNRPNSKSVKYLDWATIALLIVVHVLNTARFIIQGYSFSHRIPRSSALPSLTGSATTTSTSAKSPGSSSAATVTTPLNNNTTAPVELKVVSPDDE